MVLGKELKKKGSTNHKGFFKRSCFVNGNKQFDKKFNIFVVFFKFMIVYLLDSSMKLFIYWIIQSNTFFLLINLWKILLYNFYQISVWQPFLF